MKKCVSFLAIVVAMFYVSGSSLYAWSSERVDGTKGGINCHGRLSANSSGFSASTTSSSQTQTAHAVSGNVFYLLYDTVVLVPFSNSGLYGAAVNQAFQSGAFASKVEAKHTVVTPGGTWVGYTATLR